MDLRTVLRSVPGFPHEGILFWDITPVLGQPDYLRQAVDQLAGLTEGLNFDLIAGPESRGFIFGVPLAYKLNKGFVPVRKAGKLPCKTIKKTYDLEYGSAALELHADAIKPGQGVLIVDDLLATGGTCRAMCEMIEEAGGTVAGTLFFMELEALKGRETLEGYNVISLLKY